MIQADNHSPRMLLVLGMHRSGTSAVAGVLAQLGVDFTEHLIPPDEDNPKGYFEHADVWRLDQHLLESIGSDWNDPAALPAGWQDSEPARGASEALLAIIRRDFAGVRLAGLKDPRMCRLMPLWNPLLSRAGFQPSVVLVVRSPVEVAASVKNRDGIGFEHAAMAWLRHVLEAEYHTRGLPRVVVSYQSLVQDWRSEVVRVGRALDIAWPRAPDRAAADIEAFIEPGLRHHRATPAHEPLRAPFDDWIDRAWSALQQGPDGIEPAFDALRDDLARVDAEAVGYTEALHSSRRRIAELEHGAQWYATELELLQKGNADLQGNLQRHIDKVAELETGNAYLRENLQQHAETIAEMEAGNAYLREDLQRHVEKVAELEAGNAYLRENLQHHADTIAEMEAGNAYLRENLQRHVEKVAELEAGNAYLRENLQRHIDKLSELEIAHAWLRDEMEHVQQSLDQREQALAAATARWQATRAELDVVYASRSWRLTRPLRYGGRLARGMLGRPSAGVPLMEPNAADTLPNPVLEAGAQQLDVQQVDFQQADAQPVQVDAHDGLAIDPQAVLDQAFAAATGPRILIVTPDIRGPIRNGGIGTAFHALADTLAHAGRAVTILYTLGQHNEDGQGIARWVSYYALRGIRFIPVLLEEGEPRLDAPHHAWRAYRVYLWLKSHEGDFDIAYFPEWKGEAYFALQAKRMGLSFARMTMVVVTHSSTTWAESGNYALPHQFDDLVLEFLERRSTELADVVISPSQYMFDWMAKRGWRITGATYVLQNLMPANELDTEAEQARRPPAPITEWVFFGRLERRKGLHIFLDALRLVPAELRDRVQITFLGKAIEKHDFDSLAFIREKMADWPHPPRILTDWDRDQALEYLAEPGRVAVIASLVENSPYTVLECLYKGIPFVATDVGGIAELIHPQDRARSLFKPPPASLAQTLVQLESGSYAPARLAQDAQTTRARWIELQDELVAMHEPDRPAAQSTSAEGPHITVCLVHYDRPHLLAQALDSLRQQTYKDFDVVLVDDGSPSPAAQQYLEGLRDEFAWRGWTLHRQPNAYLGAARNAAARLARGEYVLFMDDDNIAKREELAVFARAAQRSGADILTTVSDVFGDSDAGGQPPPSSRELWIPLGNAVGLGVFRNVFGDANALIRRSLFEQLGGFTEDYGVGHEDWEFFARAMLAGADLQLIPEPLFWYRVNGTSMLRVGSAQVDHARSVRPYWEQLHGGLGPALAFALSLQRRPAPVSPEPWPVAVQGPEPVPRYGRLARVALTGQAHQRFLHLYRTEGLRSALTRAVHFAAARRQ
jgi:glycosyltransferase involved in cell wall biosynthesis/GT2 family glycosyltransferase